MLFNAIEGVVENGRIRLSEEVALPENTKVYVVVAEPDGSTAAHIRTPRLAHPEQAKEFAKRVVEASADAGLLRVGA
jgi:hypothetical protein